MFVQSITALMIASLLTAQNPVQTSPAAPPVQQTPAPLAQQNSALPAASTITVPTGTAIPLTLMNPVKSKSTKPGDSVRAVVAFPVTVGSRLAIPTGTFVEGTVTQVSAQPLKNQTPTLRVHFTQLLFANGYSVALNGENTQSFLLPDENRGSTVEVAELTPMPPLGAHFAMGAGQQTLPPLPQVGPSKAVVIGSVTGGFAAFAITMFALGRHRMNSYDFVVFDVGWQFQMVLDSPVVLDAAQVAAATTAPSTN
jgi:type IV secretion system protein VirB10